MNFITIPAAGDHKLGPVATGKATIVSPDTDVTVGYWDDAVPAVFFPFSDGLITAGGDGVFSVGIGTVIGVQTAAATRVGLAQLPG